MENFLDFGLNCSQNVCHFQGEPNLTPLPFWQYEKCSTWNISRFGILPELFHVEHGCFVDEKEVTSPLFRLSAVA